MHLLQFPTQSLESLEVHKAIKLKSYEEGEKAQGE